MPAHVLKSSTRYSNQNLLQAGYTSRELQGLGFSASELRGGGYSATDCRIDHGFTASELLGPGGFTPMAVTLAGYELQELKLCMSNTEIQRHVLMALFEATGGVYWRRSTQWGTTRPLNEWHGILLSPSGLVEQIHLRNNNLRGSLPACLSLLAPSLEYLDLYNNQLTGKIDVGLLSSLERLKDLWLNGNMLDISASDKLQLSSRLKKATLRL